MTNETDAAPTVAAFGTNDTPIWGMSSEERLRRIAKSRSFRYDRDAATGPLLLSNLAYVFDPAWMAHLETRPGTVMTRRGVPVLAYVNAADRPAVEAAAKGAALPAHLTVVAAEAEVVSGVLLAAERG